MTLKLECPENAEAEARVLMAALAPAKPEDSGVERPTGPSRDGAMAVALATLALTVPGAVLATLQIKEHLDRRTLKRTLEALKTKLAETDGSARLTLPSGAIIDLARKSTDATIDLMIEELGDDPHEGSPSQPVLG